jgi:hypothetical protein
MTNRPSYYRPTTWTLVVAGALAAAAIMWPGTAQAQQDTAEAQAQQRAAEVAAVAQQRAAESILRVYTPRFLHPNNAAALAFQVCGEDRCEIESMGDQGLVLTTTTELHAEYSALLAARDVPPPTQEFRVILLRANQSDTMPEVPADAQGALEDLRDMLAFTGFEAIDSGWLRTSGWGTTTLGEAGAFQVELHFAGDPRQDSALLIEGFELTHAPVYWENLGDPQAIPRPHLGDAKRVLSSQFGINVGETVVVGTSRMNGGSDALVVLLTALAR